jgi:hypothetical protein
MIKKLMLQLGCFLWGIILLGDAVIFTQSPIECYIAVVFFLSSVVIGSIGEDESFSSATKDGEQG